MVSIDEKISEIRREPEHIRLRWVYGLMIFSMLIILFIWVLSIKVSMKSSPSETNSSIKDISETINDSLQKNPDVDSIEDLVEEGKKNIEDAKQTTGVLKDLQLELEGTKDIEPGVSLDSILNSSDDRPARP